MRNVVMNYKKHYQLIEKAAIAVINEITIADNKQIDTIQIQLNYAVVRYFTEKGEEKSFDDDFSSPLVCFGM